MTVIKYKYKLFKKACHFSALNEVGCCILSESSVAIWKRKSSKIFKRKWWAIKWQPTSLPSPWAEMAMSLVCHFGVATSWCYIHGKGYLILHHLAGAPIQVANLVNYKCHPQDDGNKKLSWVWEWDRKNQIGGSQFGITRLAEWWQTVILRDWFFCFTQKMECEGGMEKSERRVTVWHHEACRVITNGDPEGQLFLSHPHTKNGFFSCPPSKNF